MRWLLCGAGFALGAYGVYLLLSLGSGNLVSTVLWLAGAVIVHDALIGPTLIVLGAGVVMLVPHRVRAPVAAGLVVLGTVTMTAIPVLGRFGARPDNATLLDRNYLAGWWIFAGLVVVATAAGVVHALLVSPVGPTDEDVVHAPEEG
ncbi:MAG: hypothetical protein M3Y66_06730 [Actinomycetota bacterium]|nr:hypothetical protein [Actinomycetota bacterium]